MKNALIATVLMLLTFGLKAQVVYEDDKDNLGNSFGGNGKYQKHLADNHITDLKVYAYSKKHPDGIVSYEKKFDSHGNMLEYIKYNKHGNVESYLKDQYNDSNKITSSIWLNKNGKKRWGGSWAYDKYGNNVRTQSWWKDTGNVTYNCAIMYDSNNNPKQTKIYCAKKLNSLSTYEYYDDGSKKKTTTYNSKGKVIGVWNYDCNPIGKLQESNMKDTSKICVHYETDKDGNPVKVKEEYTEGGWLFKYRLRNITKYNKDNHCIEWITMKMNGKETGHYAADYNSDGNVTEWRQYIANTTTIKEHSKYTYNNSGNISEATVFLKPSDKGSVLKFVYN